MIGRRVTVPGEFGWVKTVRVVRAVTTAGKYLLDKSVAVLRPFPPTRRPPPDAPESVIAQFVDRVCRPPVVMKHLRAFTRAELRFVKHDYRSL